MTRNPLVLLIATALPIVAGCENSTSLLYANPALHGEKEGQECLSDPLGVGRKVDLTGREAMRLGSITKVRRIEYRVTKFHGLGKECVIAQGE
jgi:hypothetical protein